MDEERLQILRLVESGRITPDQAAELLRALGSGAREDRRRSRDDAPAPRGGESGFFLAADSATERPRWLRIRVTDPDGRRTADFQVPLSVVGVALRVGARWIPQLRALDPGWVMETLRQRSGRPVFTFKDASEGDRIVISVE
ncbi:MAG TPA: hypothetical protein VFX49_05285 [Chloroflexota bacterium]|nr:hypothetical protein [Chloroflexota bacterium]